MGEKLDNFEESKSGIPSYFRQVTSILNHYPLIYRFCGHTFGKISARPLLNYAHAPLYAVTIFAQLLGPRYAPINVNPVGGGGWVGGVRARGGDLTKEQKFWSISQRWGSIHSSKCS